MATVDITNQVSEALKRLPEDLAPQRLNPMIGAAEVVMFQLWFVSKPTNKQGFPSSGFWADTARSTSWRLLVDGVILSINKQGFMQRLKGGDIRPTGDHKYLTIPASAEAYGRRARSFTNLVFGIVPDRGPALITAMATEFNFGKKRKDGSQSLKTNPVGGVVMYWLVKFVHQEADPTVLPPDSRIAEVAMNTVNSAVARALERN